MMHCGGMFIGSLISVVVLLGFAYILWLLAAKEKSSLKLIGQILAVIIVLLALYVLIFESIGGLTKKCPLTGKEMLTKQTAAKKAMPVKTYHTKYRR